MKEFNLEDLMNDVYDDATLEAVDTIGELYHSACDVTIEAFEEEGVTLSEKYLIAHALELHSQILQDLIADTFNEECCEDCENCPYADEE